MRPYKEMSDVSVGNIKSGNLNQRFEVTIDEIRQTVVTDEKYRSFLCQAEKFASRLWSSREGRRTIVGVVGGAGSGKSTFCSILQAIVNRKAHTNIAATIGMDGYHFTNQYLNSTPIPGKGEMLRTIKGDLLTIDAESIFTDLCKLKTAASDGVADKDIYFPVYDRNLHDPVQNKICITPQQTIIFFEGLHLLTNDESWRKIRSFFDGIIGLNVSVDKCKKRVIERRVRQGKSEKDSLKHFERNDLHIHLRIRDEINQMRENTEDLQMHNFLIFDDA